MLNELIQASKAIPNGQGTLHKKLKSLPNYPSYKLLLAKDGTIADVIPWHEDISNLRKWQPGGNGFSTPVFNVPALFSFRLKKKDQEKFSKAGASAWKDNFPVLKELCSESRGTWIKKKPRDVITDRNMKSLSDLPKQLLEVIGKSDETHPALQELLTRLIARPPEQFFPALVSWLEVRLTHGYDENFLKLYCAIIDSEAKSEAKKQFNILLDIPDWAEIGEYPVTSPNTTRFLNELLASTNTSGTAESEVTESLDAYGLPAYQASEKFDDIVVAGLGKITLRAMTKDARCQYRYGRADADSFVVGADARKQAKGALEFLTRREAKGKTWQFRGGNLILIYPERALPILNEINAAEICCLPDDDEVGSDSAGAFVARAERIAQAFDGKPRDSEIPVHLIVLRKPDGHRTKVAAHHFFTMAHLIESARRWVAGAEACPPISFARWGKEKGKRNDVTPETPFPGDVAYWLNTYWVRNGESQGKVRTFSLEDALNLLLANDSSVIPLTTHALRHALANWSGFLCTHGANQRTDNKLKANDKNSRALRYLPTILSLLLFKLGHTREHIMSSPAFLVGRLLALADSLHFQYCQVVRNGKAPPQLLGNALMQTTLDSPELGMALYAQRILPYQAWARTCDVPDGHSAQGLAKYFLAQLGETCAEIGDQKISSRANDAEKAQMILGYLAKFKQQN